MSTIHLGKPFRAYRGFNNLRHSPVCREGLGVFLYLVFVGLHMLAELPNNAVFQSLTGLQLNFGKLATIFASLAIPAGAVGMYYMYRCYRIPARPFWNHWQTATHFVGNSLVLGALLVFTCGVVALWLNDISLVGFTQLIAACVALGVVLEGFGLWRHAADMNRAANEGAASHYIQCTTFGKSYVLRNVLLGVNLLLATGAFWLGSLSLISFAIFGMLMVSSLCTALIGRALFYVLVVPTTMPGAFFWKNKDFEQHARDIGLAHFPQVGVVPDAH